MMDHLIDTDLSFEIDALWKLSQSIQIISAVVDACRQNELLSLRVTRHIESPAWVKRSYVIHQCINNELEDYQKKLSTNLTRYLQKSLYEELSDMYRGLRFQQKSISGVSSDRRLYFLKSENHMLLAINLCESHERDAIDNCSKEFAQSMIGDFISCDIGASDVSSNTDVGWNTEHGLRCSDVRCSDVNSLYSQNIQKCLLYSRIVERNENQLDNYYLSDKINGGKHVIVSRYSTENTSQTGIEFFKEWPGHTPTVNISWLIGKAYLANLYCTTHCDVSLTIQTCDDVIDAYIQSYQNQQFAERTFPVVLSTQWTSFYDKEIQALLGFHSLCCFVLDPSRRSVYLGVCPVQFALYVKLRTVSAQGFNNRTVLIKCMWVITINTSMNADVT